MFDPSFYRIDEDAGPVQPVVVISNQLPTDTAVEVYSMDGTATGEYCSIVINLLASAV